MQTPDVRTKFTTLVDYIQIRSKKKGRIWATGPENN